MEQRDYPPFGYISGPVEGAVQIRYSSDDTLLVLDSFAVLPDGLLGLLRTTTSRLSLLGVTFGFERMNDDEQTQLDITAISAGDTETPVHAHLNSGSRGIEGDIDARTYRLWFPLEPDFVKSDVTIALSWTEANIETQSVQLTAEQLQAAVARALSL